MSGSVPGPGGRLCGLPHCVHTQPSQSWERSALLTVTVTALRQIGTTLSGGSENKVIGDGPRRKSCCHLLLSIPLPGHCGCPLCQHSCTEGFGSCSAHAIPGPTCQTQPGLCLSPYSPLTSLVPASLAAKKEEISCVTLDKSLNLSGPQVPHL